MENTEHFQFLDKPGIPGDDNLKALGDSLLQYIDEVESIPDDIMKNLFFVGSMEKEKTRRFNMEFISFTWAYANHTDRSISLDSLRKIKFDNNLDSLIDYDKGFSAPIYYLFPLIECIRRNYNSTKVYFAGNNQRADIYINNIKI